MLQSIRVRRKYLQPILRRGLSSLHCKRRRHEFEVEFQDGSTHGLSEVKEEAEATQYVDATPSTAARPAPWLGSNAELADSLQTPTLMRPR